MFRPLLIAVFLLYTPLSQAADQSAIEVTVGNGATVSFTASDLAKLPRTSLSFQEHGGSKAEYTGVPLLDVLRKAGAPLGNQLKGKAMASYVLASAHDGYQVTFTLAELDPAFRESTVIVADQRDGKEMPAPIGPFRIVAASDKKAARSIRMLEQIKVVLLAEPSSSK